MIILERTSTHIFADINLDKILRKNMVDTHYSVYPIIYLTRKEGAALYSSISGVDIKSIKAI